MALGYRGIIHSNFRFFVVVVVEFGCPIVCTRRLGAVCTSSRHSRLVFHNTISFRLVKIPKSMAIPRMIDEFCVSVVVVHELEPRICKVVVVIIFWQVLLCQQLIDIVVYGFSLALCASRTYFMHPFHPSSAISIGTKKCFVFVCVCVLPNKCGFRPFEIWKFLRQFSVRTQLCNTQQPFL